MRAHRRHTLAGPLYRGRRAGRTWCGRALLAVAAALTVFTLPSVVTSGATATPAVTSGRTPTYWLVASDGGIFAFGGAGFYGSMGGQQLDEPVVGMAASANSGGYWEVASDGGIFTFGDAQFYGSMGGQHLDEPVVGMAATPGGEGYWEVASDGGIFTFGDAQFYGSMGGQPLNQPIVGMAATPNGGGYWLVAADGGIFAFGNAQFYGSMGGQPLNEPIVGMTAMPNGEGYIMTASDGGIFAFGDAQFYGSLGGSPQARPIVAMAMTPSGKGYWFTNNNGAVSAFGDAGYFGSAPQVLNEPVVGMAEATGSGTFSSQAYQTGSYGYDISVYQCSQFPPSPHTIGVVEVDGNGNTFTEPNPCLAQEATWAGGGLNLYDFVYYGTDATGPAACNGNLACNFGYAQAQRTFGWAEDAGVNTSVTWWLDVETYNWTNNLTQNSEVVQGAILGIRAEGINTVGIYASPGVWNTIVGDYQPAVPYWMAWYSGEGGPYNCANASQWTDSKKLPTGPVVMTQFTDSYNGPFDGDYAC